ncbi:MAG: PDZ domain-containing protein [Candidatus Acidiferrales bacterium]
MPTTTFCTLARVIAIARKGGIEPGDIIESIDDHSAEQMTLTELRDMLCQSKESVSIGIMRGKSRLRVALHLRTLI